MKYSQAQRLIFLKTDGYRSIKLSIIFRVVLPLQGQNLVFISIATFGSKVVNFSIFRNVNGDRNWGFVVFQDKSKIHGKVGFDTSGYIP